MEFLNRLAFGLGYLEGRTRLARAELKDSARQGGEQGHADELAARLRDGRLAPECVVVAEEA